MGVMTTTSEGPRHPIDAGPARRDRSRWWRDRGGLVDAAVGLAGVALLLRQILHAAGTPGIDFIHVWHATHQLLGGSGAYRDPLFTYPPGSALLLAPVGLLPYGVAKIGMLVANVASVSAAAAVAVRGLGVGNGRRAAALTLLALGLLDAVGSTWANGNVNGVLVLLEVLAIRAMLNRRWATAAVLVGVGLTVKPVLAPLLVAFVLRRKWRATAGALAVPAGLSLLGFLVIPDAGRFVHVVLPFLMHGAQLPFNDSLVGVGHTLGIPSDLVTACRVAAGASVVLVLLRRAVRVPAASDDPGLVYLDIGLAMAATFLLAPMSETYYTIYLLPSLAWWARSRPAAAVAAGVITIACFSTLRLAGVPGDIHHMTALAVRPSVGWLALALGLTVAMHRLLPNGAAQPAGPSAARPD